jgi:hypothetical protein
LAPSLAAAVALRVRNTTIDGTMRRNVGCPAGLRACKTIRLHRRYALQKFQQQRIHWQNGSPSLFGNTTRLPA